MSTVPVAEQMTAEEFLARPWEDGSRWEILVDGDVVVTDPNMLHNRVQVNLVYALESWVRAGSERGQVAMPLDVQLDEVNVFKPDVLWYAEAAAPDLRSERPYPIPSIAAEIRSPSTWRYDLGAKKASYERHGLAELWLLDTAADTVLVYRRSAHQEPAFDIALELDDTQQLTSPLLPGFALGVDELFPGH